MLRTSLPPPPHHPASPSRHSLARAPPPPPMLASCAKRLQGRHLFPQLFIRRFVPETPTPTISILAGRKFRVVLLVDRVDRPVERPPLRRHRHHHLRWRALGGPFRVGGVSKHEKSAMRSVGSVQEWPGWHSASVKMIAEPAPDRGLTNTLHEAASI